MAKGLGAEQSNRNGELVVECLQGLGNEEAAEKIAEFFSQVSQEYSALDLSKLPSSFKTPEG